MTLSVIAPICALALATSALTACNATVPPGAESRPSGVQGTTVRFDLVGGLATAPWPNDTLCWTQEQNAGPCLPNLGLAGLPAPMRGWVEAINATRGWSTVGPLVIPFERSKAAQFGPAINLSRFLAIQRDNDWGNDAIYLVDLETGLPHPLHFPHSNGDFVLHQPIALDPADPHSKEPSLTVETLDERQDASNGTIDFNRTTYKPEFDLDSDGILDVPVLSPGFTCTDAVSNLDESAESSAQRDKCLADKLLDLYESAADVLRLRLRYPLAENRQYAVVITDRLVDNNDQSIQSPFSGVCHPGQRGAAEKLVAWLSSPALAQYYGTGFDDAAHHMRFFWTFTTGSPTAELRALARRNEPSFRGMSASLPAAKASMVWSGHHQIDAACPTGIPRQGIAALLREVENLTPSEELALVESWSAIARIDSGVFSHAAYPCCTATPSAAPIVGGTDRAEVPFWLTIPVSIPATGPLRVVVVSHEQGGSRLDGLRWAGYWAQFGLATLGIDRLGGEPRLSPAGLDRLTQDFSSTCVDELHRALLASRADPQFAVGSLTSDVAETLVFTRERWRNDAIELATLVRHLGDQGAPLSVPEVNTQLAPAALVGIGTGASAAALAASLLGNEVSIVLVDPSTSPHRAWSRGATLGAAPAELWRIFGPRLAGVPVAGHAANNTRCGTTDVSLHLVSSATAGTGANTEIGCLPLLDANGARFPLGATVVATNLATLSRRCVGMTWRGEFSLGLPATEGDEIELAIYDAPDLVVRYGRDADCTLKANARPPVFVLGGESQRAIGPRFVATSGGLGLERQSTELMRALDLAASTFSLANPTSFVAELAQRGIGAGPKGLLFSLSPGDPIVPTDEGLALARAAHLIPKYPPWHLHSHPELAAETTSDLLWNALGETSAAERIESAHLDEGVPRLKRFPPSASSCGTNSTTDRSIDALCHAPCNDSTSCSAGLVCIARSCQVPPMTDEQCNQSLPDLDALAGTEASFGAVQPIPFLRLVRYAGQPHADNLTELWTPQSQLIGSNPEAPHSDWPLIALALPQSNPLGSHGIPRDSVCQRFRFGRYLAHLLGRFIASEGTDYPPNSHRDTQQCLADAKPSLTCPFMAHAE